MIGRLLESVITEFGINCKISHCVTDSGSNYVKAFKEFGQEQGRQVGNEEELEQIGEAGNE